MLYTCHQPSFYIPFLPCVPLLNFTHFVFIFQKGKLKKKVIYRNNPRLDQSFLINLTYNLIKNNLLFEGLTFHWYEIKNDLA